MEIKIYIEEKKELNNLILSFLEDPDMEDFLDFIQIIKTQNIKENLDELKSFIRLLVNISNNFHRQADFFKKLENILFQIKNSINHFMSNIEIYKLFESNKRLLLFLIKEKIITIDNEIADLINIKVEKNKTLYSDYFKPELIQIGKYENPNNSFDDLTESGFDEKRQIGENDSYICLLIRNDSVEEFITYVTRSQISLSSRIKPSIFETNSFLIENRPTLIEYAAFFGSIEIFQFLYLNNVSVDGSIWQYAIHSNNSQLIRHHIEGNHIQPTDESYKEVFLESIKCHHNDIANYIENNLIDANHKFDSNETIFQYYNYNYFPGNDFNDQQIFFLLCQYEHINIVNLLLQLKKDEIESKVIYNK